jgi:hypothetical protein
MCLSPSIHENMMVSWLEWNTVKYGDCGSITFEERCRGDWSMGLLAIAWEQYHSYVVGLNWKCEWLCSPFSISLDRFYFLSLSGTIFFFTWPEPLNCCVTWCPNSPYFHPDVGGSTYKVTWNMKPENCSLNSYYHKKFQSCIKFSSSLIHYLQWWMSCP